MLNHADVLCCTERQLVRTYPKGTRFDSSNYDPTQMWNCGIQMVALNFQYPGVEMHLNQGFFRLNGGCGYVLKPLVMRLEDPGAGGGKNRAKGRFPFSPDLMVPHPMVTPIQLEIEVCPTFCCSGASDKRPSKKGTASHKGRSRTPHCL